MTQPRNGIVHIPKGTYTNLTKNLLNNVMELILGLHDALLGFHSELSLQDGKKNLAEFYEI